MTSDTTHKTSRRVLHIGKYFPPHRGGMETVLRDQMNMQVRDEDVEVAAVVHSSERRLTDKVEIQPQRYRVRFAARWFTAVFTPIAPFFAWSVYREIIALNPDEIKIHMPNASAFWLLLLPWARKRKWVVVWHSDVLPSRHSFALRSLYWLYAPLESHLLTHADTVIATSQPYLDSSGPLAPFLGKCKVEPLALDTLEIPLWVKKATQFAHERSFELNVLFVGRLAYYKDIQTLIRAVAHIDYGVLRIVGEGPEREKLEALIKSLQVENRIKLLGDLGVADLWAEYLWCDVNCLPSFERTEAFGVVILEAAAVGKPTVVADTPGSGMCWVADNTKPKGRSFVAGDHYDLIKKLIAAKEAL